jgi:hypothetical protein
MFPKNNLSFYCDNDGTKHLEIDCENDPLPHNALIIIFASHSFMRARDISRASIFNNLIISRKIHLKNVSSEELGKILIKEND